MGGYLGFVFCVVPGFFVNSGPLGCWSMMEANAPACTGAGFQGIFVLSFLTGFVPDFYGGGCDGILRLPGGEGSASHCQGE